MIQPSKTKLLGCLLCGIIDGKSVERLHTYQGKSKPAPGLSGLRVYRYACNTCGSGGWFILDKQSFKRKMASLRAKRK